MRHHCIFYTRSFPILHRAQSERVPIFRRCTLIFYLFCLCVEMCRFGCTPSATSASQKPTHKKVPWILHKIYLYLKEKKKMYESGLNDITLSYLCYFRCHHRRIACSSFFWGRHSGLNLKWNYTAKFSERKKMEIDVVWHISWKWSNFVFRYQ